MTMAKIPVFILFQPKDYTSVTACCCLMLVSVLAFDEFCLALDLNSHAANCVSAKYTCM